MFGHDKLMVINIKDHKEIWTENELALKNFIVKKICSSCALSFGLWGLILEWGFNWKQKRKPSK